MVRVTQIRRGIHANVGVQFTQERTDEDPRVEYERITLRKKVASGGSRKIKVSLKPAPWEK
jgi:hypothetical protein